ncbi:MAG: hypothetical protein NTX45_20580 [Proteobacteria bacterium]|nr:hypothetical protein [Pseudomonadota bacterium]
MAVSWQRHATRSGAYFAQGERKNRLVNGFDALPAPDDFKIARGPKSGLLRLHATRLAKAKSHEVQMPPVDPANENTGKPPPPRQPNPAFCWRGYPPPKPIGSASPPSVTAAGGLRQFSL